MSESPADNLRYFVRSADGGTITGFDRIEAARAAAIEQGDGTLIIDTMAQTYRPMLEEILDGRLLLAGYGGWDTGKFGLERDLIEAVKKGHPALVHAFLARGADVNATDKSGGPALHWAVGSGKADVVRLLIDLGADVAAMDGHQQTARDLAVKKGHSEIADMLGEAANGP